MASSLADAPIQSVLGSDEEAARLRTLLMAAEGAKVISLFGRERKIDVSQYKPRGHYDGDATLSRYFRGAMWLSRLEFNLMSRSSRSSEPGLAPNPEETPREANDALALALLVERAGMQTDLAALERAWELWAGRREDISLATLSELRKQLGIARIDQNGMHLRAVRRTALFIAHVVAILRAFMQSRQQLPGVTRVITAEDRLR